MTTIPIVVEPPMPEFHMLPEGRLEVTFSRSPYLTAPDDRYSDRPYRAIFNFRDIHSWVIKDQEGVDVLIIWDKDRGGRQIFPWELVLNIQVVQNSRAYVEAYRAWSRARREWLEKYRDVQENQETPPPYFSRHASADHYTQEHQYLGRDLSSNPMKLR